MIKKGAKRLGLDAPAAFWATDEATLAMITGGCGPGKFGNFGWFDSVHGISLKPSCVIHDFEYCIGTTRQQKRDADNRMLSNFLKIINNSGKWILWRVLARYRATSYYNAVVEGGGSSFHNATILEPLGGPVLKKRPAPWYDVALGEIGVAEVQGSEHSKKVLEYHQTTDLKAKTDEVAWCSAFVNWCMFTSGVPRTDKANARSWLAWGAPLAEPRLGCVVVFKRGLKAWQGHVGFFAGFDSAGNVQCLGGNQKNRVSISSYPKSAVLGYRWAELNQS